MLEDQAAARPAGAPEASAPSRWRAQLGPGLAFVGLVAVGALLRREEIWFHGAHYDERVFLDAFAAWKLGRSPYSVPLFNYPPPFAVVGGWLWDRLGQRGFLLALRHAELLAACGVAWLAVGPTAWRGVVKWLVAAAIVGFSVPVGSALGCGNVAPLIAFLALAALSLAPRRPLPAGVLLGVSIAAKPMALAAVPLLALRPGRAPRQTAATAALAAAGLLAAFGATQLPGMLGRADVPAPSEHDFSLGHLLRSFGIAPPAIAVLLAVVAIAAIVLLRRRPDDRSFSALTAAACVASLPVVWPHTLVFTFPLQALALERALAAPRSLGLRRPLAVALVTAAIASIQGSSGSGGAPIEWSAPLRGLVGAIPLFAVLVLCAFAIAEPAATGSGAAASGRPS